MPPGYAELTAMGMGMDQRSIMTDEGYGQRHGPKREELADQKLMDDLKKGGHLAAALRQTHTQGMIH
jgi:hypothetical protein